MLRAREPHGLCDGVRIWKAFPSRDAWKACHGRPQGRAVRGPADAVCARASAASWYPQVPTERLVADQARREKKLRIALGQNGLTD